MLPRPFHRLGRWFKNLRSADAGNVTIMFSVSLVALIGIGGAAIDYIRLIDQRTVYAAAADSAALAAVAAAREAERNGQSGIPKIAKRAAEVAWNANVATAAVASGKGPQVVISKKGNAWSAHVSYDEATPTTFMGVLGVKNMRLAGESTASTTVEKITTYWDFHIAIDTSSSMGIGATQADMDALQAHPSINCMFACHWADYSKGEEDSVTWAKKAGIKLRVDIVDDAVDAMVKDMQTASTADNVRAKLWALNDTVVSLVDTTKKLNDIKNHKIELYRTPVSVGNTNYRAALAKLETEVGKAGGGKSAADPKKAVFIVTDGIHDAPVKESNHVVDWPDHYVGP